MSHSYTVEPARPRPQHVKGTFTETEPHKGTFTRREASPPGGLANMSRAPSLS
jgi:hypothetical protein